MCGGWDAHNVTEDADLGFRLVRLGLKVGVIGSDTMEEAPVTFYVWLGQRTRWLKGWLQTYLVHMRSPRQLWRDLGARNFLAFQVLLAGMVLSALVHPWVYVMAGYSIWHDGMIWGGAGGAVDWVVLVVAVLTFATGLFSAAALQFVAARRRYSGEPITAALLLLPIYWLGISLAAYRAIIDLCRWPYYWEKTPHRARP